MLFTSSWAQIRHFNDVVLHNIYWSRVHTYTVFKIKAPNYTGWTLILVDELYEYLTKDHLISKDSFIVYVGNHLYENGYLTIPDTDLSQFGFQEVSKHDSIKKYASLGKKIFLEHYFQGSNYLQLNISAQEKRALIAKLFEWNIACKKGNEFPNRLYILTPDLLWSPIVTRHPTFVQELMMVLENIIADSKTPRGSPCRID